MPDTPEEPVDRRRGPGRAGVRGTAHERRRPPRRGRAAKRKHAPWEFLILTLFVLILCIGIILGWTLVGSKSPEKLDVQTAGQVSAACDRAVAKLKALPDRDPTKENGTERAARVRAENGPLREMVAEIADVHPKSSTQAKGLAGWTNDWSRMIDAARGVRRRRSRTLASSPNPDAKVRFIYPASNAITPITQNMDDYVRESTPRLNSCFTTALQLEIVEGPRVYEKVTS